MTRAEVRELEDLPPEGDRPQSIEQMVAMATNGKQTQPAEVGSNGN